LAEKRVELFGPAVEDRDPGELRKAIGQALSGDGIVELGEGVVLLDEAELGLEHLLGQPVVAVDVDLDGEGKPSLETDVDQAKFGVEEIEVQDALRSAREGQTGSMAGMRQLDGAAGFHAAENGDQTFANGVLLELLTDERLFSVVSLKVSIGCADGLRRRSSGIDEFLRLLLDEGQEVLASLVQNAIDPRIEVAIAAKRKMTFENHSIMAAERGYNRLSEFLPKAEVRRHGVLLPGVW